MSHRRKTQTANRRTGRCERSDGQHRHHDFSNLSAGDLATPCTTITRNCEITQCFDNPRMAQCQLSQLRQYRAIRGVKTALVAARQGVQRNGSDDVRGRADLTPRFRLKYDPHDPDIRISPVGIPRTEPKLTSRRTIFLDEQPASVAVDLQRQMEG
jgi:hypothetical protein